MLTEAACGIVDAVFKERKVLDHQLASAFARHPKWGKRDRAFVAETVFEVVRWRRALAYVAGVPETDTSALCAIHWHRMGFQLPADWSRGDLEPPDWQAREESLSSQPRAVRESIPDWLDEIGFQELGPAWDAELTALNRRARVYLRVNSLLGSQDTALTWLAEQGIGAEAVTGIPGALVLAEGKTIPKSLRAEGIVEIQDAGSQCVAPRLQACPGETVIDACCGAGGKTLHLAGLMENRGVIHALDIEPRKLEELGRRAQAAGVTCIKPAMATKSNVTSLAGKADRLLIDAPCSGLGTLKRQPDLKWRLTAGQLERVGTKQRELLGLYPSMLRSGGILVYATCSILPSENRAQISWLLASNSFELISETILSPAQAGYDGFYAAVLRKH